MRDHNRPLEPRAPVPYKKLAKFGQNVGLDRPIYPILTHQQSGDGLIW